MTLTLTHWRERLGAWLIRTGYRLISDRHAAWLYGVETDYWQSPRGQMIRRRVLSRVAREGGR